MTQRPERTIFNGPKAKKVADELKYLTEMLGGLVLEGIRDNPAMILSPIFRRTLVEKAEKLNELMLSHGHTFCMDIMD